ncbi:MAG TPA: CopG family transcriptional regulator [bacterium]|nr:CopG family transcriptional regulator [bacterium]
MMNAKRFQIYLEHTQHVRLQTLARERNQTMASLIREAVDLFLQQTDASGVSLQDPLWSVIGTADSSCPDTSP